MSVEVEAKPPAYRSVSQRNQYDRCPQSYYLARIKKVWQKPAAWLPMGSAVHEGVERWEKSGRTMSREEAEAVVATSYDREVSKYTAETPNFDWWQSSGPYRATDDLPRRFDLAREHINRYIDWAEKHPNERMWETPPGWCDETVDHNGHESPGKVASELGFNTTFGSVPVRGFIDLVVEGEEGLVVRDVKTGNTPGDDFQLGVYAAAIAQEYDVEQPTRGDYFMTKTGKPTLEYDISEWTPARVAEEFEELEDNIQNERFDPKPDPSKCRFCDVASSCDFRAA
ncbi:PD-(D/E)XK nuclease family protein [Gordonia sp. X0973]|uniref:RecB family exonuclease n=1 Tax=Gordonia sp. X0973 TaxID=2742602 RepID=UPI000F54657C|nr:PD-(D/E)XK nuclease family protein [Gordonia sp. X0973]QKT07917.1 PD-(D/E)XK nuclease family protein [Gordonia sp. X0973]